MLEAAASGVLLPLDFGRPDAWSSPLQKRGTAMGVAGIVMSAGPAVGPVLGGAMIDAYGRRVTLGCIVPLALAVLLCGVFLLENVGVAKRPKLDAASIALSTIAIRRPALRILERLDAWLDEHRSARHYYCRRRMPCRIRQTPTYARGAAARFALPEIGAI